MDLWILCETAMSQDSNYYLIQICPCFNRRAIIVLQMLESILTWAWYPRSIFLSSVDDM